MEIQYQASDRLNIAGNYSYTKTEYGEDYFVLTVDDPTNPLQFLDNVHKDMCPVKLITLLL